MIRPLADRLVVLLDKPETVTGAGIVIPDAALDKPRTGTVLFVGPKAESVKAQDRVLFPTYAGVDLDPKIITGFLEDRDYLLMSELDVIAIID